MRAHNDRESSVSAECLYLVVWQMTAVLYISNLDEVDWNRRLVVPRDELKPPVSPFLKVVGGGGLRRYHTAQDHVHCLSEERL